MLNTVSTLFTILKKVLSKPVKYLLYSPPPFVLDRMSCKTSHHTYKLESLIVAC